MHLKHWSLNRTNFKTFLWKRYPQKIAERMTETCLANNSQMNYDKYYEFLSSFISASTSNLLNFTYQWYDISSTGEICEHDVFQILDMCKENIPVQEYVNVLESSQLYIDVNQIVKDNKQELFNQTFIPDLEKMCEVVVKKMESTQLTHSKSSDGQNWATTGKHEFLIL